MARPEEPSPSAAAGGGSREPPGAVTVERSGPIDAEIRVPSSKSLTQRALVCAALAPGLSRIGRPLAADDTILMLSALRALGARMASDGEAWLIEGIRECFPSHGGTLRLGNAGTAMRFLTPVVALGQGSWTLDGSERMRQRPVGDLLEALRSLGVEARSYRGDGCPPVEVAAAGLPGGKVSVRGSLSSQFISGLLLAAPRARADLTVRVEGPLVSRPYVRLTIDVMRRFGAEVRVEGWEPSASVAGGSGADTLPDASGGSSATGSGGGAPREASGAGVRMVGTAGPAPRASRAPGPGSSGPVAFQIRATGYRAGSYDVEGDASSACWWFAAAAVTGGRCRVRGIPAESAQGDLAFLCLLERMGCAVSRGHDGKGDLIEVRGGDLRGIEADLGDMPDAAPALGAVALFASTPTRILGAAHLRAKESDRIAGLAGILGALGGQIAEHRDGLTIRPGPLRPAALNPLGDHRLAMAGAIAALGIGGIRILDPGCVTKSYPGFFEELARVTGSGR